MTDAGLRAELAVDWGDFSLDVTLDVRPGQTVVLMGPNGAGKTTCLNLIAGLKRLEKGRVTLDGTFLCDTVQDVDVVPEKRSMGVLFQDGALFPHLTVLGNVPYGARAKGRTSTSVVSHWIERLDLGGMADRQVHPLSGGEKQRVDLARALASGAKLLLLDEPFASLDISVRASVRSEMRRFIRQTGLPALVVAHDPVDALVMGDRIVVLEWGRVVQNETEGELLVHPRTPFVAGLVGLNYHRVELAEGLSGPHGF